MNEIDISANKNTFELNISVEKCSTWINKKIDYIASHIKCA